MNKAYRKYVIAFVIISYVAIPAFIQRMKCPKMTETELFFELPRNLIFKFKSCQ